MGCTNLTPPPEIDTLRSKKVHRSLWWMLEVMKLTGKLGCWSLRLMEFDFGIIHHPRLYLQAADVVPRLYKGGSDSSCDEKDADDNILSWSLLARDSAVWSTIDDNYSTAPPISTSKNIFDSQQTNTCCQCILKFVRAVVLVPRWAKIESYVKMHLLMGRYKLLCWKPSAER